MRRELLILRHAKSSWGTASSADFDRPLSARGIQDASVLADWLVNQDLPPRLALCSSARRTRETAELVLAGLPATACEYRESLYHAGLATLVNSVREQPDQLERLMLVGHNPGLDQLLIYLCDAEITLTGSGKLMTTAALAWVETDCTWQDIGPACCRLLLLRRPAD